MTTCTREVVAALEQAIAGRIGEPRYKLWFPEKTKLIWHEDRLTVGVPNHFYKDWLQRQFADAIAESAAEVIGRRVEVAFAIDSELFRAARNEESTASVSVSETQSAQSSQNSKTNASLAAPIRSQIIPRTRRWHQLQDFVVGACNRVAHASAVSAVESGVHGPNPLVLHGPVGTGKTHLLEGIYAGLRQRHPSWRVVFSTAEEFTNRFLPAMRFGKLSSFRKHFRESDALLVDDLNFLAGKRATQEEFLHTFNALCSDGKQVLVTCDCHPRLAEVFLPELTDRLLGGAVWGLMPPDAQTRIDLLRAKAAKHQGPLVPEDVLKLLAEHLRGNVRELEGALHCVRHYGRVAEKPIDLSLAREALVELFRHTVRVVRLEDVDRAMCSILRLETGALQSRQRTWSQAHPRMLALYLARKHTNSTYSEAGAYFGKRNHSTAVAAEKKVRQWLAEDGKLRLGERELRVRDVVELAEREMMK